MLRLLQICPVCRKDIKKTPLIDDIQMQQSIKAVCRWQSELRERYIDRVKALYEWKKKQEIYHLKLKAGDKVDILDREGIWCVGTIELIIRSDRR